MLEAIDITNVLFLDIETVSAHANWDELTPTFQDLWALKAHLPAGPNGEPPSPEQLAHSYRDRAAIFAEFGKIICISVGIVRPTAKDDPRLQLRLKSFAGDNEAQLLAEFVELLQQHYANPNRSFLCGHNIKEFDIPYICRRLVVNGLPFPSVLDLEGKKPWETKHLIDTMELWKFGDRKSYTSLKLLAAVLDFPSPKDDIDGSMVGRVYWEEQGLERIAFYCEKDVLATVQLFLRYRRQPILQEDQISHLSRPTT